MLERIKACLPSLAPAEQRVARLVLADPRAFASLPITELASRAHVSKPTVVRFCRNEKQSAQQTLCVNFVEGQGTWLRKLC